MLRNTVLLVDDKEINRMIYKNMIGGEYRVAEASDGNEAIEMIKQLSSSIAVIFLDIIMPNVDGFGVLDYMKENNLLSKIPVILVTTDDSSDAENKAYEYDIADYIRKPCAPGIVRRRMKNIIDLYAANNRFDELSGTQEEILQMQYKQMKLQNEQLKKESEIMTDALSTIVEFRSFESGRHIQRIKCLTKKLAEYMADKYPEYELDNEKIDMIKRASALHDVGKIAVPDAVLMKPGRLNKEEFEVMKKHSTYGYQIIENFGFIKDINLYEYSYQIARWHHERFDGRGYPDGLSGDAIPIAAQIVSIADVYEALVSKRVYKDAYSHAEAVKMIDDGECGTFNPKLLKCFDDINEDLRLELLKYDASNGGVHNA